MNFDLIKTVLYNKEKAIVDIQVLTDTILCVFADSNKNTSNLDINYTHHLIKSLPFLNSLDFHFQDISKDGISKYLCQIK